jgi:hypothetical protein
MCKISCCSNFCSYGVETKADDGKASIAVTSKVGAISSTGHAAIGTNNGNLVSSGVQSTNLGNVANYAKSGVTTIGSDGISVTKTKNLALGRLEFNQEENTIIGSDGIKFAGKNTYEIGDEKLTAEGKIECCTDQCCVYEADCCCCEISLNSTDCTDCMGGCCESATQVVESAVIGCLDCAKGCCDCAGNCAEAVSLVATGCFDCLGGAFSCIGDLASTGLEFVASFVSDD